MLRRNEQYRMDRYLNTLLSSYGSIMVKLERNLLFSRRTNCGCLGVGFYLLQETPSIESGPASTLVCSSMHCIIGNSESSWSPSHRCTESFVQGMENQCVTAVVGE